MTKVYRTAIVGTGAIADAHARAVHAVPEHAFTGRPVRRGGVSAAFAERMDGTGAPWRQLT